MEPAARARVGMRGRRWLIAGSSAGAIAITAATWAAIHFRPLADPEEIEAIGRRVSRVLDEAERERCLRPVLRGEAVPGSGRDALGAALDPAGPHASCWAAIRTHQDALIEALTTDALSLVSEPQAPVAEGTTQDADEVPVAEGWPTHRVGRAIQVHTPPIERDILAACGGATDAIREALSHEDLCSPFGLRSQDVPTVSIVAAARALGVLARERIRAGDPREGVEILLDAIRLGHDLGRGPSALIAAMAGVAAIDIALGQLETMLAHDLSWSNDMLGELQRQVELLARSTPHPDRAVREDATTLMVSVLASIGWTPRGGMAWPSVTPLSDREAVALAHAELLGLAVSHERLMPLACAPLLDSIACVQHFSEEAVVPSAPADEPSWWVRLLGPRSAREWMIASAVHRHLESVPSHVRRIAGSYVAVRAVWIVLEHRRRALVEGRCPSVQAFVEALRSSVVPTEVDLGGTFDIAVDGSASRVLEISAPSSMRPPQESRARVRLPVARAYCPPLPLAPPEQ